MARDGDAPPSEQPETTTTTTAAAAGGAGGKIRKPPLNRNRPNPYARPPPRNQPQPQPQSSVGGWLSKLVDPAYRLISGGANRILPSFLSKSLSFSSLPSLDDDDEDNLENEVEQDNMGSDPGSSSNVGLPGSITNIDGEAGVGGSKSGSFSDELKSGKVTSLPNDNALKEIEQLIKQKMFSRHEMNHLLDILNSCNTGIPNEKGEMKSSSMIVGKEAEEPAVVAETSSRPNAEKQEKVGTPQWKSVSPPVNPNIRDEIGASPIEIARAYMGKRMSGIGSSSKNESEDDKEFIHGDGYALKPPIPSPSPKPSVCWPGAVVHDEYLTPQVQRGRYWHRSLARTPYSRSSHALSRTKPTLLRGGDRKYKDVASTPFQPLQTPIFGQQQSSRRVFDGEYGSGGPIRSSRHNFRSGSARRLVDSSPLGSPFQKDDKDSIGSFPFLKKNVETGGTSRASMPYLIDTKSINIESHATAVPMHSSQMARKILEHLDRNVVTVKDRSAELKLAAFGKKAGSSNDVPMMPPKDANLPYPTLSLDRVDQSTQAKVVHVPDNRETTVFKVPPERSMTRTTDALSRDKASDTNICDNIFTKIGNAGLPSGSVVAQDVMVRDTNKMQGGSSTTARSVDPQMHNLPNIHPTSTTKSALPSISIDKPESKRIFSSENSSGFTFPISTSSAMFPEPPTPSIMPPLMNSLPQSNKESEIPSYNFGSKRSSPAIVFSFPSTSNAAIPGVDSDLKFTFGSDKKRISFSSIGKDTICC